MTIKIDQKKIYVKKSRTHGYGVFAKRKIKKGEVIEQCVFLFIAGKDKKLEDYQFAVKKNKTAIILGFGSIYNHDEDEPNASYTFNRTNRIATFKAARDIKKDEEILICYGDKWFSSRGLKAKKKS